MSGLDFLKALWAILFDANGYVRMCAVEQSPVDMARRAALFRRSFWNSLICVLGCTAIVIALASWSGQITVDDAHEFKPLKLASLIGNFLMAWATWFMLGEGDPTFDGDMLDERLRPFVFKLLFAPGLALTLLGGL